MPELPEVETVRRQLQRRIAGGAIASLEIRRPDVVRIARGLGSGSLRGARIARVGRRGKLLVLEAKERLLLLLHLGMTGRVEVLPERRPGKHTHFILEGKDRRGRVFFLHFHDPRRFGGLWLVPASGEPSPLSRLGPDALDITPAELAARLGESRAPLKPFLLDQERLAGIGNIYADEILHRCRLHPLAPASSLGPARVGELHATMGEVLRRAIRRGGSSVRDYVQATGEKGSFQEEHAVYGRAGEPCRTCSTPIRRVVLRGRGTHYCPRCQRPPRAKPRRGPKPG